MVIVLKYEYPQLLVFFGVGTDKVNKFFLTLYNVVQSCHKSSFSILTTVFHVMCQGLSWIDLILFIFTC